ncbi:MAG TPA: tetratricopeptide repeat protein [Vicinamibacterales bacterium]|nr:tetratricopeptide repeat protein [Vicinamibacterales bacterium]
MASCSLIALLCAVAATPTQTSVAAQPAPSAIVGVDGADWLAIDKLTAAGRLPTFAALKKLGRGGVMRPEPPLLSPLIWTSIATGRRPEDHGVLDFMVDVPGRGPSPVSGAARTAKALWEIFSEAGRPVFVAGWWATWPADRVRGAIVSDRLAVPHMRTAKEDAGLVFPPDILPRVKALRVEPDAIDYAGLNRFVPLTRAEFDGAVQSEHDTSQRLYRNPFAHVRAALAATLTYKAVAAHLLPDIRPSFAATYYELVDTTSHLFANDKSRRDAAVASAYREVDDAIRETAKALDPETLVLVMSDHGFYPSGAGIAEDPSDLTAGAAAWHRPYGIIVAATAGALTGARPPEPTASLGDVSPLDIAPTILARAGLPVANDMPGRVVTALAGGSPIARIASHGAHILPQQPTARDDASTRMAFERLKSLGYVSGTSTVTSLARVNLGEILFRKGDYRGAIRELEAVLRADPPNQHAPLWLARAYAASNREADAVHLYDQQIQSAVGGATVDPIVVLAATDFDLAGQRTQAAAERLAHLPAALDRTAETMIARGSLAAAQRKSADAERLFRAALAAEPANFEALSRLVDLLLREMETADAARTADAAAKRFPDSPERLALAGETALAERRYGAATRWFAAALALAPDAASVRVELARANLAQKRVDAALDALGSTSTRDAEILRGAAFSQKGDWRRAADAYQRALAGAAPTVDLLNALGHAQLEAGRLDEAASTLQRSLAIKADQPDIRLLLERARKRPPS